jgi:hypothetical protein
MEGFNPQVYNFTFSDEFADSVLNWELESFEVNCPRYQVLLDHTVAVVWHLFSDGGNELLNLNKSDISWALKFLEAIDTSDCDASDTKDIHAMMRFMRKVLIARYSMEDEAKIAIDNQTFHESIKHDTTLSLAFEDFFEHPDVSVDKGKSLPIGEKQESLKSEEPRTKAEVLDYLKKLQGDAAGEMMSLSDAIAKLTQ